MKKKIVLILLVFYMIFFGYSQVLAGDTVTDTGKEWLKLGEDEIPKEKGLAGMLDKLFGNGKKNNNQGFEGLAGLLMGLGIFVVAIVGVILGIRLMFTQPDQKARAQEALVIYIVGAVIIFGAVGIWRLLITILDGDFLY